MEERKKYQVFISSTYRDLIEERTAVTRSLLEMNCIPVGMEQFPASDMSQMEYIRMMLDDCDYYILILAGKYGTLDADGVGFTEKEYDYAISKGIPVMSFVVKDIGKLKSDKCENDDSGRARLASFRVKVCSNKLVKFYSNIGELQAAVSVSLFQCMQQFPAPGWVRGDILENDDSVEKRIEEYMRKHTATDKDIDALFHSEGPLILNGGNASGFAEEQHAESTIPAGMESLLKQTSKVLSAQHSPKVIRSKDPYLNGNNEW